MKTNIIEEQPKKEVSKYPYVGKYNGNKATFYVLFSEEGKDNAIAGTVIHDDDINGYCVGHYSTNWTENKFEVFTGKIVIDCK